MTSDEEIQKNKTKLFKRNDKVVMHTCHESTLPIYKGKIWTCETDSFLARDKSEVVFLEGFSGYFSAKYLQIINNPLRNQIEKLENKNVTTIKEV